MDFALTHRHGGNNFVAVQRLPQEYCHVVSIVPGDKKTDYKLKLGNQFLLAWEKLLSPEKEIPEEVRPELNQLRNDLKSGAKIIRERRVIETAKA